MTPEEAIKILTPDSEEHFEASVQKLEEAERLGAEALERIKEGRGGYTKEIVSRLPSETEE